MNLISIGQLSKELGVSIQTIRRWEKEGKLTSVRTKGSHRRYDLEKVSCLMNKKNNKEKLTAIYVRVSTPSRKNDLEMQKQVLQLHCAAKGWKNIVVEDIGSGLNYNKKGLLELIELIEMNKIERLVLNYKDRLLRFGSEIIFQMCKYHNVEVEILTEAESKSYEEELVEDVLSIITVFSAKLYGSRSHKNKKIVDEAKELFKKE